MPSLKSLGFVLCTLLLVGGCQAFTAFTKLFTSPPELVTSGPIQPNFELGVNLHDLAEPPTDYELTIQRSGVVEYHVVVRAPRRKEQDGTFDITEDQIASLWKAVVDAKFDTLWLRYPSAGDGSNKKAGRQKYYVKSGDAERSVESFYESVPELEALRKAVVAVVPKDVRNADGDPGRSKDPPKEYVGDMQAHRIHRPDCPLLKDVPADRRKTFASPWDALDYNFQPCPECDPLPAQK